MHPAKAAIEKFKKEHPVQGGILSEMLRYRPEDRIPARKGLERLTSRSLVAKVEAVAVVSGVSAAGDYDRRQKGTKEFEEDFERASLVEICDASLDGLGPRGMPTAKYNFVRGDDERSY